MSAGVRTVYSTYDDAAAGPDQKLNEFGCGVAIGVSEGTVGVSVFNSREHADAFAIITRDELRAIGEAIARELALQ